MTAVAGRAPTAGAPMTTTPFVGLMPYAEDDAPFFFGRDEEKAIVTANLKAARLTILYGPSGVGKSSLLLAGVVHDLRARVLSNAAHDPERAPFAVCVFRSWRDDALPALAESIRAAGSEAAGETLAAWDPSTPLVETLREWTKSVRRFLVVLDQFEDYFLYNADERAPGTFDAEFPEIVNDANLRVNVLVSIREDAWARLDRFEGRIPQLFANYIRVDHLDRDAARQAVQGPIGEWNRRRPNDAAQYSIDAELIDAVVEAAASGRLGLGEQVDGAPVDGAGVETGVEAPFLQLVMDRLWTATVEDGKTALTLDRLRELGGAEQIVQSHLVDALGALNDEEQAIAAELFRFLVTRSKTKIAHPASDLAEWTKRSEPDVIAVLEQLCRGESGRILRAVAPPDGLPESTRYELFHDVLAEPILDWRKHYEQARELEQLEARRVAEEESARTAEAQRQRERRNRLIRRAAIVLLVLTAALIGVSVVAFLQRQDAIGFAHVARSQRLASLSSTKFGIDPGRALMLGAAAVSESPTEEARAAFSEALAATGIQNILSGHEAAIRSIAFSPDGRFVVTAGDDREPRVWRVQTGELDRVLRGAYGRIAGVAFNADGTRIVAGTRTGDAHVWDRESGELVAVLRPSRRFHVPEGSFVPFPDVSFSASGRHVLLVGSDGAARVWALETRRELLSLQGDNEAIVNDAMFSPDGHRVIIATDQGTMIWNVATGTRAAVIGPGDSVARARFTADGRRVVTVGAKGVIGVWRTATGKTPIVKALATPDADEFEPFVEDAGDLTIAVSGDGTRAFTAIGQEGTPTLWNVSTRRSYRLETEEGAVAGAVFTAEGRRLVTARPDGSVRVWDAQTGALERVLRGPAKRVVALAVSPNGRLIAAANEGRTTVVWTTDRWRALGRFAESGGASSAEFSPNGAAVAVLADGRARIGAPSVGTELTLRGEAQDAYPESFSADGRFIVTTHPDGAARVWKASGGRAVLVLRDAAGGISDATFSADGRKLLTSGERSVKVWSRSGRLLAVLTNSRREPDVILPSSAAALSADGARAAVASFDVVRLVDVRSARVLRTLRIPRRFGFFSSVRISPDNRRVVAADDRSAVVTWALPSGRPRRLTLRRELVLALNADGDRLLTAGRSGALVRDAQTGALLSTRPMAQEPEWGAFSADGAVAAAGRFDGAASIWTAASGTMLRRVGRAVSPLALSHDGRLVAASSGSSMRVLRTTDGRVVGAMRGTRGPVDGVVFSPAGRFVVTLSEGVAHLRRVDGTDIATFRSPDEIRSAAFTGDGRSLVTATQTEFVVWDTTSSQPLRRFKWTGEHGVAPLIAVDPKGDGLIVSDGARAQIVRGLRGRRLVPIALWARGGIERVVFSSDGKRFVTLGSTNAAYVWETASAAKKPPPPPPGQQAFNSPKIALRGHTGTINDAAFAPDGTSIVTAGADRTAIIWTAGGTSSRVLRGHTQPVVAVSFSPDGDLVLTRAADGSVRVWSAATGGTCAVLDAAPSRVIAARFPAAGNGILTVRADGVARLESEGVCGLARGDGLAQTASRFLRGLSSEERRDLEDTE